MKRVGWIDVDLDGLAQILARRGKQFAIYELLQNAWDEKATQVMVVLERTVSGLYSLVVEDDCPEGFRDLSDAYTLYAPSYKKNDPTKRGLFNAGEKLVLALSRQAKISSTKGSVVFTAAGRRQRKPKKRDRGTVFEALVKLEPSEYEEMCAAVQRVIPPVKTVFNGQEIMPREPVHRFQTTLQTVISGEDGALRHTQRQAEVRVYEVALGESPTLYEMGIPVVDFACGWHTEVMQKVPLNIERDNVTPSYARALRVAVVNEMSSRISKQDATETWVREATSDPRIDPESMRRILDLRFGEKRVSYDPSDPEGSSMAVAQGYTVVSGGALSAGEWANARRAHALSPAGQVTPSPKAFNPDGRPLKLWKDPLTPGMERFERFVREVSPHVAEQHLIEVQFANDVGWRFGGCFGKMPSGNLLVVNVAWYGRTWFDHGPHEGWFRFLIHEVAHSISLDHLSDNYHKALTKLGAKLTALALNMPTLFQ